MNENGDETEILKDIRTELHHLILSRCPDPMTRATQAEGAGAMKMRR